MDFCSICNSDSVAIQSVKSSLHNTVSFVSVGSLADDELGIALRNVEEYTPYLFQDLEYFHAIEGELLSQCYNGWLDKKLKLETMRLSLRAKKQQLAEKLQHKKNLLGKIQRSHLQFNKFHNEQAKNRNLLKMKISQAQDLQVQTKKQFEILHCKRIKLALKMFDAVPIEILHIKSVSHQDRGAVNGCSSIMGIPLPNNGYYEETSIDALNMAIYHLTHLVDSLSTCLHIPLPHLLSPEECNGPTVAPQYSQDNPHLLLPVVIQNFREKHRYFEWTKLSTLRKLTSTDDINDKDTASTDHLLINRTFYQALILLQANVISLCLLVGIPPEKLWPNCAMLLNLHELQQHLSKHLKLSSSSSSSKPTKASLDTKKMELFDSIIRQVEEYVSTSLESGDLLKQNCAIDAKLLKKYHREQSLPSRFKYYEMSDEIMNDGGNVQSESFGDDDWFLFEDS